MIWTIRPLPPADDSEVLRLRRQLADLAGKALEYASALSDKESWKEGYPRYARELADLRAHVVKCRAIQAANAAATSKANE